MGWIDEYERALTRKPDHYWAYYQLGRCYLSLGQAEKAVNAFDICVALRPDAPWAHSQRGLTLILMRRIPEGMRSLESALQHSPDARNPDFAPARLYRGIGYWKAKKHNLAVEDFDTVLALPEERQLIEAAYYRGLVHLELGDQKKALQNFDQVIAKIPHFVPAYLARTEVHFLRGKNADGLADLNSLLALVQPRDFDPQSAEAHHQRGRLLRRLVPGWRLPPAARKSVFSLARDQLQKAAELGGRSAALFNDLGAVLKNLGQSKAAVDAYSQGLALDRDHVKLLVNRGWVYAEKPEHYEKAQVDFARAVRLNPRHAEAHAGLGFVQACLRAPNKAQRAAAVAILRGSDDYLVLHNVACTYAELSRPKDEQEYQDMAMDVLRQAVAVWEHRGKPNPSVVHYIRTDSSLDPLRKRPDFKELLKGR